MAAESFLDEIRRAGNQAVVNDLVVSEAYFAAQYHYGVPKPVVLATLARMLQSGEILSIGEAAKILTLPNLHSAKPGFVDRLIHAAYVANGGRMATFEKSASRLPDTVVLK